MIQNPAADLIYPPHALPALEFVTHGPDGSQIHYRVDEKAPISLRDRALLRALLSAAYGHLNATEGAAQIANGGIR
ncbi:hypothetical protein AB0M92_19065 [Streptomyces sp. NPDC051582]|uniref:hypothetical protein n=1 Tax=Streptomyces sp. NPDC051582 TaxID=3155167 RepID=UPI003412F443